MTFGQAVGHCFANYATTDGRASRSEYWYWVLFDVVAGVIFGVVDGMLAINALSIVYDLAVFLPSLAVSVRRLHDIDRSGYWAALSLVPILGWIVLIFWACTPGTPGPNSYGRAPA